MGHRSSKLFVGPTNGNTSSNKQKLTKETKLSKNLTRRYSSRHSKSRSTNSNYSYRNSTNSITSAISTHLSTVCGDSNFLPILRLDGDSIAESAELATVTNNSAGQIIIKIRFKTHSATNMENMQNRALPATPEPSSRVAIPSQSYPCLVDNNSNKMPQSDTDDEITGGSIHLPVNNNNNNSDAILPIHLNALRISEPLRDDSRDSATSNEYYGKDLARSRNARGNVSDCSQTQRTKSPFMNFTSILESSCNSKTRQNNNNNANNSSNSMHSQNNPQSLSLLSQSEICEAAIPTCSASNIYHNAPTDNTGTTNSSHIPISVTTSRAKIPPSVATTPTNQLTVWAPNKDVIISSINSPQFVVVCPPVSLVTLGRSDDGAIRLVATEVLAGCTHDKDAHSREESHSANIQLPGKPLLKNNTRGPVTAIPIVHSQVDFVHYLVPDLERIFNSSFYWGKMDRYEAERLLEGKPEGTFLLRDSAQEEYLFSVTFRKYGRSLHARIEQNGHKFSFDCHDPAVFSTSTVTGLLEHYKDPGSVMFFEPMLTVPFHRKTVFSLQRLARATIVSNSTYDGITELELPARLKAYLKEYHYKQKLRVKLLDDTLLTCT